MCLDRYEHRISVPFLEGLCRRPRSNSAKNIRGKAALAVRTQASVSYANMIERSANTGTPMSLQSLCNDCRLVNTRAASYYLSSKLQGMLPSNNVVDMLL